MAFARAVVFDLDGTLVDTRPDIARACNHALVRSGRRPLGLEAITRCVGDGARRLCARAAGIAEETAEVEALLKDFLDYYLQHPVVETTWMPQALTMLKELGALGAALAVCTNKPQNVAQRVLEELGVVSHFTTLVGGGATKLRKPDPEPLQLVARLLGVECQELVMVGDGRQDVLCGKAAGARTIAFLGGYTQREDLAKAEPDAMVECLGEVPALVRQWRREPHAA